MKFEEMTPERQVRTLRVLEIFQMLTTALTFTGASSMEIMAVIELFRLKLPAPCCEQHGTEAREIAAFLDAELQALLLKGEAPEATQAGAWA